MSGSRSNVAELCPAYPDRTARYFVELPVSGTFQIPEKKPSKDRVVKLVHEVVLEDVETVAVDLPEPGIDGNVVFVAGSLLLGVQYLALCEDQSVHYVRFQLPFEAVVQTDCGELIPLSDPLFAGGYVAHVCVEKVEEIQFDCRTIHFDALLLVWLEQLSCPPGLTSCAGACVNLQNDPTNCGACGNVCDLPHATAVCVNGTCQVAACQPNWGNCDGDPTNGCEANLLTDSNNCGSCGHVCPPGTRCLGGVCR